MVTLIINKADKTSKCVPPHDKKSNKIIYEPCSVLYPWRSDMHGRAVRIKKIKTAWRTIKVLKMNNVRGIYPEQCARKEKAEADRKEAELAGLYFTPDKGNGERYTFTGSELAALRNVLNLASPARGNAVSASQMVWRESYTYDNNGNRESKTTPWGTLRYEYDRENRLVRKGDVVYVNDRDGNLLSEQGLRYEAQYAYNGQNRMVYSEVTNHVQMTYNVTMYAYDALGRRTVTQSVTGETLRTLYDGRSFEVIREGETFRSGSLTTQFSGSAARADTSNGNATEERYRWIGDGGSSRLVTEEGYTAEDSRYGSRGVTLYARGEAVAVSYSSSSASRSVYLGKDVLGSVRSATTDSGNIEDRYEYDAFGTPYKGDLSGVMNLGYTGKPYEVSTGFYNYGYRDYKPQAARFTTVDPIRDGSNWFSYVNSDPVNFIDLWGLAAREARPSSIGNIPEPYSGYRMHKWADTELGTSTVGEIGCKVIGGSQIVSSATGESITPDIIVKHTNGNFLNQSGIVNAITENGVDVIISNYKPNVQILDNIRNGEGTTYILGKADIGGGIGEHWVVITDYYVYEDGTIFYIVNGTSKNDDYRIYTSGYNFNSDRIGTIEYIETYTVK